MTSRLLGVVLAMPLLVTGAVLTESALNRRGEHELRAAIELSEREVTPEPRDAENTTAVIRLSWREREPRPTPFRPSRDLPRRAYVALELDLSLTEGTRLVVAAIDTDPAALEARFPDGRRHLVTAAVVRGASVSAIDPGRISVPAVLASRLPHWAPSGPRQRSHLPLRLSLRYGRHWEPWVVAVRGR